jgi:hypothetical protein
MQKKSPFVPEPHFRDDCFKAVLGGLSSVFANLCTHPIETCKVRMILQTTKTYKSLPHCLYLISTQEGFGRAGIYKGIEASSIREASNSTLRLGLYEPIKRYLGATDPKNTPLWVKFTSGALAGMIGSGVANPVDLLKTKMQVQSPGVNQSISWHAK